MSLKDKKYKYNQTIMSVLGYGENKKIRIVTMGCLRTAGVEDENDKNRPVRGSVNDEKLAQSIARTKRTIYELVFCNPWDFFFTATLDPKKYDRTDLDKFHHDLTLWFRHWGERHGNIKIRFLLVPELHKDGKSWHLHGFIYGLPLEHLEQFKIGQKMGKALAEKVKKGDVVYNWPAYQEKFGFCDLEPIRNHEAVAKYMTKYINKELADSVTEIGAHKYYCSRGLNRAEVVKKGTMSANIVPDYVSEYGSVTTLDFSQELYDKLLGSFLDDNILHSRYRHVKIDGLEVLPITTPVPFD